VLPSKIHFAVNLSFEEDKKQTAIPTAWQNDGPKRSFVSLFCFPFLFILNVTHLPVIRLSPSLTSASLLPVILSPSGCLSVYLSLSLSLFSEAPIAGRPRNGENKALTAVVPCVCYVSALWSQRISVSSDGP
jgi:hypothetical protein